METPRTTPVVIGRFLFLLGLVVWMGGLAFVAIGAPAMFRVDRSLGPQMVGAAISAFTNVTYVCAVLIVVGLILEASAVRVTSQRRLWMMQGVITVLMAVCVAASGRVVLPQLTALQPSIIAIHDGTTVSSHTALTHDNDAAAQKQVFDKVHRTYRNLTSLTVLLGLGLLLVFCVRTASPVYGGENRNAYARIEPDAAI